MDEMDIDGRAANEHFTILQSTLSWLDFLLVGWTTSSTSTSFATVDFPSLMRIPIIFYFIFLFSMMALKS